jgi:hypothetical protein
LPAASSLDTRSACVLDAGIAARKNSFVDQAGHARVVAKGTAHAPLLELGSSVGADISFIGWSA